MKHAGLIIIGLFTTVNILGQSYYPIVQDNNEWNVMYVIYAGPPDWDTIYWTNTYKFEGDTIINNLNYLKVYKSEEVMPFYWTFEGCIREDQDKKVFFREWDSSECLMYDFGAEVGDTLDIYDNTYPIQVRVESIDSIFIIDSFRKRIYLSYIGSTTINEIWIEGIGSNRGILESGTAGYVGGWRWFICMLQNGELVYMNPNYNSCYLISTGFEEKNNSTIQVYPNPASNRIKIKTTEYINFESISIIDLKGQKLKEFEINNTELDLSGISSGVYLLKLTHENGEIIRKIMIE